MTQVVTPARTPLAPATEQRVVTSDDPSPLARTVARRLAREGVGGLTDHSRSAGGGVVVLRSHDTPQVVAVLLDEAGCTVVDALPERVDAEVTVDIGSRFAVVGEPGGERDLWSPVLDALHAPPPPWREEAHRFWDATRDIVGMPDVLVVQVEGADGVEELHVGSGSSRYVMAGTADQVAGVFSGADDLLAALASGLAVQGTLADLSVMTAASWRVRYGF